jgi:23S rRNA pseudouridine1911/1915/1917 synthase
MGNPIVGDLKYGAPEPLPDKSLALSAVSLTFEQATGDESVTVTADRPEVWNRYLSS